MHAEAHAKSTKFDLGALLSVAIMRASKLPYLESQSRKENSNVTQTNCYNFISPLRYFESAVKSVFIYILLESFSYRRCL